MEFRDVIILFYINTNKKHQNSNQDNYHKSKSCLSEEEAK